MTKNIDPAHLAKLTNISLTQKEVTVLTSQFSETLNTISVLNELDTKHVSATPQVTNLSNVFRNDVIETEYMFSQEEALANAPNTHQGFIVVKAVFDDN
jgi:aspartyl-tRNA(Asn)/glutamyl-tRNA(Gln) amidotransferase subunit C